MADGKVLHMAPQANRVPRLMGQLFDWLATTREHPLIASRRREGIDKAFFEERASKLKRELIRALGGPMAARYAPQRQGSKRLAGHALGLEPRQIRFGDLERE